MVTFNYDLTGKYFLKFDYSVSALYYFINLIFYFLRNMLLTIKASITAPFYFNRISFLVLIVIPSAVRV